MISIIVTTLNAGELLKDLFNSISSQNYKTSKIEIIVNDDDRTNDNTPEVIEAARLRGLEIHHIHNNKRLGHGRLEGAKVSKGVYLMHIDADMQLTPGLIEECIKIIEDGNDAVNIPEEVIGEGYWTRCKWIEKRCYIGDNEIASPRFFSRESYFSINGHNPRLALSEDKDIDLRLRKAGGKIGWSEGSILHNEGRITPIKTFRNKFFWSQTGFEYLEAQPKAAWKQVLLIFFRPAYFRNWKLLLSRPHLTFGMYVLKIAELSGAILGGIKTKLGSKKEVNYKTVEVKKNDNG